MRPLSFVLLVVPVVGVTAVFAQTVDLATVLSKPVSRTIDLPAELLPFLRVSLYARVVGQVDRVLVDRGSAVKIGDPLIDLTAPEMKAQIAEFESRVLAAEAEQSQAEVQVSAARSTADRLKEASKTPGAIAENELILAQKQVEAAEALVRSRRHAVQAASALVQTQKEIEAYLKIVAPFEGIVTERLVHPGALVGPGSNAPLLVIEQVSHLRLLVPVPEEDIGGITQGAAISFRVPAYPERNFVGKLARTAHVLDQKTRTMAVELDVMNKDGSLAPGMYPSVKWPVHRARPALWVPKSSVVTTTERMFVIRAQEGRAQWVDVKLGASDGDLVEVTGDLHAGNQVLKRATDETRDGQRLNGK